MNVASPSIISIINAARNHWVLGNAPITLIAERENSVYRVDTAAGPLALRLHRAGYRSISEIDSELMWMDMLAKNGITVPSPVPAPDGSCLHTCEGVTVSVLSWVDGIPLSKITVTPQIHFDLGQILSRMHSLADAWTPPDNFTRPSWELLGDDPSWGRFWENRLLSDEQTYNFLEFRDRARVTLDDLRLSDNGYGLIHADLVPDNVLSNGKTLQLIDFDDGGYGYHLFDLATITHRSRRDDSSGSLAEATINGYCTDREIDTNTLMLFEALRACSYVGWNISRMDEPDGIQRNARFIVEAERAIGEFYKRY